MYGTRSLLLSLGLGVALAQGVPLAAQDKAVPWWERIRVSGDMRMRDEGFFQDGADARNRLRFRYRLGLTATINPEWEAGFRLASGEAGNITSSNQSFDDAFTRKAIEIDRAFIRYSPKSLFGSHRPILRLTGGKFSPAHFRPAAVIPSEMVFDNDVSVEGFHQEITALARSTGLLRRLEFHGDQWIVDEVSRGEDAWVLGGQGVLRLSPGGGVSDLTLAGGVLHFTQPDRIAMARNGNGAIVITNGVRLDDGTVIEGGVPFSPGQDNPIVGFVSRFTVLTGSAAVAITPRASTRPISAFVDLAHNTRADDDHNALWAGAGWGRLQRPGDWTAAVAYARTEKEAVISAFSYSDLGRSGGTNTKGWMLQVEYQAAPGIVLAAKHHLITLIRAPAGQPNPTLHCLQVDVRAGF